MSKGKKNNLTARIKDWEARKGRNTISGHEHKKPGSQKK